MDHLNHEGCIVDKIYFRLKQTFRATQTKNYESGQFICATA